MQELAKLAEKDPEFYKYLQENDRELLEFDLQAMDEDSEHEDGDAEALDKDKAPVLTMQILQRWQKALLEVSFLHTANAISIPITRHFFFTAIWLLAQVVTSLA